MTNDVDHFSEEDFADLIHDVRAAGDVPEPSPLFWNHLSARVRDAVAVEPIPRTWWMGYWRPVVAAVGSLSFVALLILRASAPAAPVEPVAPGVPGVPDFVADVDVSEMWRLIEVAAPQMEMQSVRDAGLMPTQYATDQAIEALTPSEREALVRLLRKEIGASE